MFNRFPLWKRFVTVDDDGIHEHRRGRLYASIRWDQLDSLSRDGARGHLGTRISLRLSPTRRREFEECASAIWRQRHPDRWQQNRERTKRAADWAAYFWFPLLTIGPCIASYILFGILGWPGSLHSELQKVHLLTALGVVCVIGFVIWYGYKTRKTAGPPAPVNPACPSPFRTTPS